MLKSNIEIANTRITSLHNQRLETCKMNKSNQATKTNLKSKQQPVSFENDTFSLLSNLNEYLQKDIDFFQVLASSFESVDHHAANEIKHHPAYK